MRAHFPNSCYDFSQNPHSIHDWSKRTNLAQPNFGQPFVVSHLSYANLVGLNSLYVFVSTLSWLQGTNQDNLGFVHPTQACSVMGEWEVWHAGTAPALCCTQVTPWLPLLSLLEVAQESRCLLCHLLHSHRPQRLLNKAIFDFQVHFLSLFLRPMRSANVKCKLN